MTKLVSNFDAANTNLLLIDNECKLDLNACYSIIKENFSETHIVYNNTVIEKSQLINHLPLEETKDGFLLNAKALRWDYVSKFSNVILITDEDVSGKWNNDKLIDAIFYRFLTGKNITLIVNRSSEYSSLHSLSFYPYFTTFYTTYDRKKSVLDEITDIEDLEAYENSIREKFVEVFTSHKTQTNRSNRWKPVDISKYTVLLNYAAQKKPTSDVLKLIDELIDADRINPDDADQLKREVGQFINTLNPKELRFYNAYESLSGSLTDNLQVSIAGPDDDEILVLKTTARDYLFRNLRFKNVLVNLDSDKTKFVFPIYDSEQPTRQTIRFLMMNLYNVHNNSPLVDFIVIYLLIKVTLIEEGDAEALKLVKTKYKNIHLLFAKRYEPCTIEFIDDNKKLLVKLKRWFKELEPLDEDDLHELFTSFVQESFEVTSTRFKSILASGKRFKVGVGKARDDIVNHLPVFKPEKLDQLKPVEIKAANWPSNQNYECDSKLLQLNASFPFFICCKDYNEFLESINSVEWINDLRSCLNDMFPSGEDKLVLKGGSILDIMCGRKPKDYDIMNVGMTNEQFLQFITKFVRKTKAVNVKLVLSRAVLFRVTMPNGDLLEFILNVKMSSSDLFQENYLPDQICYKPVENKLYSNEYTLWGLNYGYCPLELETHPPSRRLSNKLHLLGFNFFYEAEFKYKTRFLKERLERLVWLITTETKNNTPSHSSKPTDEDDSKDSEVKFERGLVKMGDKIVFANKAKFNDYIRNEVEENKKNVDSDSKAICLDFKGAVVLSEEKFDSVTMNSTGLDWSYVSTVEGKVPKSAY